MLVVFVGVLPAMNTATANSHSSSSLGITKTKNLGSKIKGLQPPPSSVRFGNTITCVPMQACFGTNNDDIMFPGAESLVFGLQGNDMIFGALNDQIYAGSGNDIVILGAGHSLANGGSGDDSLFGGLGNSLLVGGAGNDKLFAGPGTTVMSGGSGADHFNCPLSIAGLARSIVLDYNPSNGDTISGTCTLVNTQGSQSTNVPNITLPNTGDTTSSGSTGAVVGGAEVGG